MDCAIYVDGDRAEGALPLERAASRARDLGGLVWVGLHDPTESELAAVAAEFGLHPLAVEDALHAHQRPKLETYDDMLFVVLKAAHYVDTEEVVEVGQVTLFLGPDYVVTARYGDSTPLSDVRVELEAERERLACGAGGVLHAVVDHVVDQYEEVLRGLDIDVDEIEMQVFSGDRRNHAERIYKLKREVLEFRRAVVPLDPPLQLLSSKPTSNVAENLRPYFRDVHDHVLRVRDHIEQLDRLLDGVLDADVAQVSVRQNEDMRKISAWVAIAAVPTMIAGIYGMNFEHMPELRQPWGYPAVLLVMVVACSLMYRAFRRNQWL